MSQSASIARGRDTLPMTVAKMGFLIDRLNQDCSPLQFLRELTKNSIESIQRNADGVGEVRWDVDWNRFDLTGPDSAQKLCIIDTGIGMTGEEMVEFINKLSSSVHKQSATGNFGVGAKISAAPINPDGLVYLSWKDSQGYMIHLHKDDESGEYGLVRFENGEFWSKIQNDVKPEPIESHGTAVILLGRSLEHSTMEPPPNVKMPRKWILRYLNSRFFRLPSGVSLKVREGWDLPKGDRHSFLRTVTGQGPWLDESSLVKGVVELPESNARAHWWIVGEEADTNSGHYNPPGQVGALYQDELYETVFGPAGIARLQSFGIVFGGGRIVVYIEPNASPDNTVHSNTARTQLLINNEAMDWAGFASEFRERMPPELAAYQDEVGQAYDQTDHRKAIRERLKTVSELFRFGRYRPKAGGKFTVSPSENTGGGAAEGEGNSAEGVSRSGSKGGKRGDLYALFAENSGEPANFVDLPVEPEVKWVYEPAEVESFQERAARYLSDQNLLLINGEFTAITEMVERWVDRYAHVPGARKSIREVVQEWFEQQLMETVMSALALKQSGKWSTHELAEIWSEHALTAAVLPRYHIDLSVKRILGQRLGRLANAA